MNSIHCGIQQGFVRRQQRKGNCMSDNLHADLAEQCMRLEQELAATKQKLEAAEQAITANTESVAAWEREVQAKVLEDAAGRLDDWFGYDLCENAQSHRLRIMAEELRAANKGKE